MKTLLFIALLLASTVMARDSTSVFDRPVLKVESSVLSAEEVAQFSAELGIVVGKPLDRTGVERKIRALYGKTIENFVVEAEISGSGLKVYLVGARRRILRTWSYNNIENEVISEIGNRVGVLPGQPLETRNVNGLVENIRVYLQTQGYYHPVVRISTTDIPHSNETDLEVTVTRNDPTTVKAIKIQGVPDSDTGDILAILDIAKDKTLKKADLERSVEKIARYLRENQYPMAKVEDVHSLFSEDKKSVELTFSIKSGRRIQMQFIGNSVFDDMALRDGITEQILSETDSGRRIGDVIERRYREVGYHFCRVSVRDEERGATLFRRITVDEGQKVFIDKIQILGGGSSQGLIEQLFFDNAPGVLKRRIFWEKGLEEVGKTLENRLIEMGYLKARINSLKPVFSVDNMGVQLFMEVELGNRSFIDTVDVVGNDKVSSDDLKRVITLRATDPYNASGVEFARLRIREYYQERGFNDIQVAVDEKPVDTIESSRVLLRFTVVEGIQYRVGEVTIQGNLRTDPAIILSEMRLQKGDLFSPSLLKQSEENIGLLGIFSKVEMVAHSSLTDPRSKDIKIAVTESKPGIGEIGMGAAYEAPLLRLRSFVGIAKRNLFGRNHTVSLRGELTVPIMNDRFAPFLEYATVLGLRSPNPFQIPAIFTASLGVDRFVQTVTPSGTSITNYTLVDRARLEERLEKKITDHTTLSYRIHHFEKTVTYDSATRLEQAPETIGSIGPGIIIDRRDDTFNPTIGSYHSFDVEFAHPALFSSANIEFVMGISRNSFYLPFIFGTALKIYVGLGYARSIDPNDSLPQIRLANDLALGGQNSIRGYLPRSIKAPYPGTYDMAFYNARGEVSFPIFGDFSAAVFADTGQLFDNVGFPGSRLMDPQDYRTRRDGVGVGFRYKTPVGPFVVDFAEGLGQANPTIQFYFTLGTL